VRSAGTFSVDLKRRRQIAAKEVSRTVITNACFFSRGLMPASHGVFLTPSCSRLSH
jgi:hypothetical protein